MTVKLKLSDLDSKAASKVLQKYGVKKPRKRPVQHERIIQIACVKLFYAKYPREIIFHTANGGYRRGGEARAFQRMGVKAGIPDLCVPVPRAGYHGFWAEIKYGSGDLSDEQKLVHSYLKVLGYKVVTCWSVDEFERDLYDYMSGKHFRGSA